MNLLIALLIIVLILIIVGISSSSKSSRYALTDAAIRPYLSKAPLTPTEIIFYHRLREALPEFIVLAQVQLSSFIKVDTSRVGWENYLQWFNPIAQQSVDFLVCDHNFSIITAIELDDKSHTRAKSIKLDEKKNKNLEVANVPLIRWHAEAMPRIQTIQQVVMKYVTNSVSPTPPVAEWLVEDVPLFLKKQENSINHFVKNACIWLAIIFIVLACVNLMKEPLTNLTNKSLHKPELLINETSKNNEIKKSELLLKKQQREEELRQQAKIEANQIRLEMIRQQNQEKLLQAQEVALKQEAWERYAKKSVECTSKDDMVTCGNTYIRKKAEFEQYWKRQHEGSNNE